MNSVKGAIAGKPAMGSARFDVSNHQLHGLVTPKLVEVEFVGQLHPLDGRIWPDVAVDSERDAIELHRTALASQHDFEVTLTDNTLLDQLKHAMEQRLREMLTPWTGMPQGARQFQVKFLDRQRAVRQQPPGQILFAQLPAHFSVECLGEQREIRFRSRGRRTC